MKKFESGGMASDVKDPQKLVDNIAKQENKEDRELITKPAKAAKDKIMSVVGPAWQKAFDKQAEKEAAEKQASKESREASGRAAVKGMTEGRMDAMGNAYKKGGKVSSASKRGDGCAVRGKTKGRMV